MYRNIFLLVEKTKDLKSITTDVKAKIKLLEIERTNVTASLKALVKNRIEVISNLSIDKTRENTPKRRNIDFEKEFGSESKYKVPLFISMEESP